MNTTKQKTTNKKVKLSTLKPNPDNPRLIKDDKFYKLVESIKTFGEKMMPLRPIVIDENKIILGGNMRFKALKELGYKEIPTDWIKQANDLSDDQKKEFIIKDNVGFGDWDFEALGNDWDGEMLEHWGVEFLTWEGVNLDDIETSDEFDLPDGDKEPFQQITFTLADEQSELIKNAIKEIKSTEEFKYVETFANENSNGNALYLLVMKWKEMNS
tara:strand:+ start:517 stop:1158 length:642 start_codon:yes stop_codon:yes gene_type:complete